MVAPPSGHRYHGHMQSRWSKILPDVMYLQALDLTGILSRQHPDREEVFGHSFLPLCSSSHNFLSGRGPHCRPGPKHTSNQGSGPNPSSSFAPDMSAGAALDTAVCRGLRIKLAFCSVPHVCVSRSNQPSAQKGGEDIKVMSFI